MEREEFWNHPPKYLENSLDSTWVRDVVKADSSYEVVCRPLTDVGGMMSTMLKVTVAFLTGPKSYVLKQIVTEKQRQTSRNLKLSREAYFYKSEISKQIGTGLIATCVYSYANEETGEKYVMLEDVGKGASWIERISLTNEVSKQDSSMGLGTQTTGRRRINWKN